jgi:GST-like protein
MTSNASPGGYELFGARTGNCIRAAIALEMAEIAYSVRRIDLAGGEQRGERHLMRNPLGKVPVLTSGGGAPSFVLAQSNAIVLFAAERAPARLLPGGEEARMRAYERYFHVLTDIIAPNHAAFRLDDSAARGRLERIALDALGELESTLADQPFLAGARFSIADIAGFTIARALLSESQADRLPRLAGWLARVGAMPAVQHGLAAFS